MRGELAIKDVKIAHAVIFRGNTRLPFLTSVRKESEVRTKNFIQRHEETEPHSEPYFKDRTMASKTIGKRTGITEDLRVVRILGIAEDAEDSAIIANFIALEREASGTGIGGVADLAFKGVANVFPDFSDACASGNSNLVTKDFRVFG